MVVAKPGLDEFVELGDLLVEGHDLLRQLYEPGTGRFFQQDPEYGGGANACAYCDGVNCQDIDGFASCNLNYDLGKTETSDKSAFNYWKSHFKSIFPIPGRPGKITKKG
ncbi:hypothetical protein [Streptomyces sp. NPDC088246]|uniref:hypothetical protein n=1 Tax=Streptomyces sp. NPDC088246 TaxID=3365842 RepID=UPI00382FF501